MGPDDIHPFILKSMADIFTTPITHIFKKSIELGLYLQLGKAQELLQYLKKVAKRNLVIIDQ